MRQIESGRRLYEVAHWAAFVLGLGALEINVVYPALALLYVLFRAPRLLKRVLPMCGVSVAMVAAHFYFRATAACRSLRAANRRGAGHDVLDLLALGAGSDARSDGGRRSGVAYSR